MQPFSDTDLLILLVICVPCEFMYQSSIKWMIDRMIEWVASAEIKAFIINFSVGQSRN